MLSPQFTGMFKIQDENPFYDGAHLYINDSVIDWNDRRSVEAKMRIKAFADDLPDRIYNNHGESWLTFQFLNNNNHKLKTLKVILDEE
jgi:hypothetical protein